MVHIHEEPRISLDDYSLISIAFRVTHVFDISESANFLGQFLLKERALGVPYIKDYDAVPGNHPTDWARKFDLTNWGLLSAQSDAVGIGGAVIAFQTEGIDMLAGRDDLAVLWDLRVAPKWRGKGIGATLFGATENWARSHRCRELKIETRNNNVPVCKFYAHQGCELRDVVRFAYPQLPNEMQLLWYKRLKLSRKDRRR